MMMIAGKYPPVVLVKTWILIATSDREQLQQGDHRAQLGINQFFGSITLAELYIEQMEDGIEIILV